MKSGWLRHSVTLGLVLAISVNTASPIMPEQLGAVHTSVLKATCQTWCCCTVDEFDGTKLLPDSSALSLRFGLVFPRSEAEIILQRKVPLLPEMYHDKRKNIQPTLFTHLVTGWVLQKKQQPKTTKQKEALQPDCREKEANGRKIVLIH